MKVVGICQRCGARWTAERFCHCNTCHQTFTGHLHCDAHRRKADLSCKDPARMGLTLTANGAWGTREDDDDDADDTEGGG